MLIEHVNFGFSQFESKYTFKDVQHIVKIITLYWGLQLHFEGRSLSHSVYLSWMRFMTLGEFLKWVFVGMHIRGRFVHGDRSAAKFVLKFDNGSASPMRSRHQFLIQILQLILTQTIPLDEEWHFHPRKWDTTKILSPIHHVNLSKYSENNRSIL